jgi:hypothetical protein
MKHRGLSSNYHYALLFVAIQLFTFIGAGICMADQQPVASEKVKFDNSILQFKSGDHIAGFSPGKAYIVSPDHALSIEFVGGSKVAPQSFSSNKNAKADSPTFLGRVEYKNIWPGITLRYDAVKKGLAESTYIVSPGSDISKIKLRYNAPVTLQKDGSLKIGLKTKSGEMKESAPVAWQEMEGRKNPVQVSFVVAGNNTIGFSAAGYDRTKPLIIDPVYSWHTFYGPSTKADNILVDGSGNIYVSGNSYYAWNGPAGQAPLHSFTSGRRNQFVLKLDSSGGYVWHTFYRGISTGIARDSGGNIYTAAYTDASWNFIDQNYNVISPLHPFIAAPSATTWTCYCYYEFPSGIFVCKTCTVYAPNVMVLKLNSAGAYQWHTFYGAGTSTSASGELPGDYSFSIGTDSGNNLYMSGRSSGSWNGPGNCATSGVSPCPLHSFSSGTTNFFVMKLNSSGTYQWHTFYKFVHMNENVAPLAVDSAGNSYIVTSAHDAWTGPLGQAPLNGYDSGALSQAVAIKLNSSGAYQWHAFFGDYYANAYAVALDSSSNVYLAGDGYAFTVAGQQPVDKGCQNSASSSDNLWVMKLNSSGSYQWHTCYYSGQTVGGIGVDSSGNSYVTGSSFMGLGTPFDYNAIYNPSTPSGDCDGSAYVLKISSSGSHVWHAYFGGNLDHYAKEVLYGVLGKGVVPDSSGNVYVTGYTYPPWKGPSNEAPLHAYSTPWITSMGATDVGNSDMFVLKMASSGTCSYFNSGDPLEQYFGSLYTTVGGNGSFPVDAQSGSGPAACSWTPVSSAPSWLHITSASPVTGNGTVNYSVDSNGSSYDRTGTITIGSGTGQYVYTVYQQGTGSASASVPTVTTNTPVTGITDISASSGGNVTTDGGAVVLQRGVCWSETADPTTDDTCTTDGAGSSTFTSSITGLNPDTTYHVRAYATNAKGDGYGSDVQFTTTAPGQYLLTVLAGGNGYGAVSSSAGDISYTYPEVSSDLAVITTGASVTVTATAADGSSAIWYDCDTTGGSSGIATCGITSMTSAKTVRVSFETSCAIGPVRKDAQSYYDAIQAGYTDVADSGTLQMQAQSFTENISINRNVNINLKGGYDCSFSANSGWTTVSGVITISSGKVTVENIKIK